MMSVLKTIRNFLIFVILFGTFTAFLDYNNMVGGSLPVFCVSKYDEAKHFQSFRGMFYQASRVTKVNDKESLLESSDINFYVLTKQINIPSQFKEKKFEFTLSVTPSSECLNPSVLYFGNDKTKIYTYCLDKIDVVENGKKDKKELLTYLEKDTSIIEDVIQNMNYRGLYRDNLTEVFESSNDFSDNKIKIYKCNNDVKDIYIVPGDVDMQEDFCTYKMDVN